MRFVDDLGFALSWLAPEPKTLERASHALVEGLASVQEVFA